MKYAHNIAYVMIFILNKLDSFLSSHETYGASRSHKLS